MCFRMLMDLLGRDGPGSDELTSALPRNRGMAGDDLVDLRLRERGLVAFVMAVAAIPHEIDQEVEAEPVAVGPGSCASMHATGSSALTCTIGILKPRQTARITGVLTRSRPGR